MRKEEPILFNKENEEINFDMLPNYLGIDDTGLDEESIKEFRKRMDEEFPNNCFNKLNNHDFLKRIGAFTSFQGKEVLRNGAVLFFGFIYDIIAICPNYFLDYQVNISGFTRWDKRIVSDDINFNGNLFNYFSSVSNDIIKDLTNLYSDGESIDSTIEDIENLMIEAVIKMIENNDFTMPPGVILKKKNNEMTYINSGHCSAKLEQYISSEKTDVINKNITSYFKFLQKDNDKNVKALGVIESISSYGYIFPSIATANSPKRTTLILKYIFLNKNDAYYEEKRKLLSYLVGRKDGSTSRELSTLMGTKPTTTNKIIGQLLSQHQIKTNDKKTKGRRYFSILQ